MSESSLILEPNSQTLNGNRGGEKKVMKKSLSVLVAGAMVSSMFASIAFAADTQLTTQQKLDALIAAGIFDKDGTGNGSELDANMTREQLAKILFKLKGLTEVSGTSYGDVAADRWSAGFIQAVTKATPPLMEGQWEGVFNPAGDVTIEELATVAVRALGLQVDSSASVTGKVSDWAKGYVGAALKAGILPNTLTDFTAEAIRSQLVEVTYAAKDIVSVPGKVSVKEAKATGVSKVQVTLDKAVDTAKATLTLKKGAATITTTATWSDDKKTATLALKDTKLSAGDYTVTLGGLEASEIATASASFKAENETVSKIEFVTASEEIAKAPKVTLKIKASNQYGEAASFPAGSYSYLVSANGTNPNLTKGDDGLLQLTLNTSGADLLTGIGVVPITVYHNETRTTVTKTFKVGTEAYVAKVEAAEATYSNERKALASTDDKATIKLTLYDQYGGVFTKDSINATQSNKPNIQALVSPYEPNFKEITADAEFKEITVQLNKNVEKNGEYTITIYAGTSSTTAKVKVESSKVANKVEFVDYAGTLATGDVNKYIVINAYDAAGNKLSADDIVTNAQAGRFSVSINGAITASEATDTSVVGTTGIVKYGEHKGKIKLSEINSPAKGIVYANLGIYTANVQNNATLTVPVVDARVPSSISIDTEAATKAVLGAESKFKFLVKDQYGEKLDSVATSRVEADDYKVVVTVADATYGGLKTQKTGNAVVVSGTEYSATGFADFNAGYIFTTTGVVGKVEFEAKLYDTKTATAREIASVKRSIETVNAATTNLTYSINAITDLFAAQDSALIPAADKADDAGKFGSTLAKAITITAKDGAGNVVALPAKGLIQNVTSSNPTAVTAVVYGAQTEAKVLGNKAGTSTINVLFQTAKGELQTQSVDVVSKADAVAAVTVTANAAKTISSLTGATPPVAVTAVNLMGLKVKDNYGIEFSGANIAKYSNFIGVLYSVSDVKLINPNAAASAADLVTIDQATGAVTRGANVAEFVLKATTNNGKTASTVVTP
ncbi:hypothetical protein [Paenibacillus sp. HJGM_3]|uniref:hypothetical protein n=1 Tax=Paenibacillus sp. HJGM_3 TaxID=3379816 RepID=UPI00385F5A32